MRKQKHCFPHLVSRSETEVHMAKVCLIEREQKRRQLVKKFAAKRESLIAVINDSKASVEDRREARQQLQKLRSEEHTSELQSLMRHSYAVFSLKKKK